MSVQIAIKHIEEGEVKPLIALLENLDVNSSDVDGQTLLHHASKQNRYSIAKALLNAGANINAIGGPNLETPVQFAIRGKFYRLAEFLYQNGADLQHKSSQGLDSLHNAVRDLDTQAVFLLLFWGAASNSLDDNGDTPLTWVLENKPGAPALDIVRLLVKYDTDSTAFTGRRTDGNTPLHVLVKNQAADPLAAFEVHQHKAQSPWIAAAPADSDRSRRILAEEDYAAKTNAEGLVPYSYATAQRHRLMQSLLWDAMFFNKLPHFVPTWVAACSVLMWYIAFHTMYPLYALLFVAVWAWFLQRWLLQWTIVRYRGRTTVGAYVGALGITFLQHIIYISSSASFAANVLVTFFFVLVMLLSAKLHMTKPKCLKPSDRGVLAASVVAAAQAESNKHEYRRPHAYYDLPDICGACTADRRYASRHCEECGQCVVGQSLHFPPLNVCIGEGNRRLYCGYLLFSATYFALAAYLSYSMHASAYCDDAKVSTDTWIGFYQIAVEWCMFRQHFGMWVPFSLTLGAAVYMLGMLQFEANLVSRETSFHLLSQHLFDYHQGDNSIHSGANMRNNLREFVQKGSYRLRFRDACVQHLGGGDLTCGLQPLVRLLSPVLRPEDNSEPAEELVTDGDKADDVAIAEDALLEEGRSASHRSDRASQALRLYAICEQQKCDYAAEAAASLQHHRCNHDHGVHGHNHDHSHGHSHGHGDASSTDQMGALEIAPVAFAQQITRD